MATPRKKTLRGRLTRVNRKLREWAMVTHALASTKHPVLAQIVPTRFCNLACGYCNEYDKVSQPVPLEEMIRRINHLGKLGTAMIGLSGGEPMTHPEIYEIVRAIRKTGAIAGMITNGYLLNVERIEQLNAAGLDHMQISIDNLEPDDVSLKSLKVLDKKLEMLAQHAVFHVTINSVLGGGINNPNDALVISKRAQDLGFESTLGIIHGGSNGQLKPLNEAEMQVYYQMTKRKKSNYSQFDQFQEAIVQGQPNQWRCRAGSRYLYVSEHGSAHLCSQRRNPWKDLLEYTQEDLNQNFRMEKHCAPMCTIGCVHRISYIDHWRAPQTKGHPPIRPKQPPLVQIKIN